MNLPATQPPPSPPTNFSAWRRVRTRRIVTYMRPRLVSCASILALLLSGGCGGRASKVNGTGFTFVPSDVTVHQGEHIIIPRSPANASIRWTRLSGPETGYVSRNGSYHAPLTMPAGPTPQSVLVQASDGTQAATVTLHLYSGPVQPGDCLAPGQDTTTAIGNYVYVEELPEAIVRVPPAYPDLAREAGVEGTVFVWAFVCACGEVGEVRIAKSIPMLDEAAKAAVRQWIFNPALSANEPVAVWVGIPVKFTLH